MVATSSALCPYPVFVGSAPTPKPCAQSPVTHSWSSPSNSATWWSCTRVRCQTVQPMEFAPGAGRACSASASRPSTAARTWSGMRPNSSASSSSISMAPPGDVPADGIPSCGRGRRGRHLVQQERSPRHVYLEPVAPISYWHDALAPGDDLRPRSALPGDREADVAIVGAGFTGLWTAYSLLRREPSLRVVVLEAETAGFGASGRNGAWCNSAFPVSPGELARRFGVDAARDLLLQMRGAVEEVGRVARVEGIDAQYFPGGQLRVARGSAQVPGIKDAYEAARALGLEEDLRLLDAEETARRVRITGAGGALYNPHSATIHPARLTRGLARAVERLGGEIFEQTPVTDYETRKGTGGGPRLVTRAGEVRARTVVLAGEAYLARLRKLRRQVLPIYSLIVLTEPLSETRWAEIGWEGRECVASNRYTVDYLSRTADGRILFGGRGAPYHYGSRIEDEYDAHDPTHQMLRNTARAWFPVLESERFTHTWGGPLA